MNPVACVILAVMATSDTSPDPYLWLEEITGDRAMQWVQEQNARSSKELEAQPDFQPIRQRLLSILDSKEKIPYVTKYGDYYYNFWRDGKNVRGLWRRTTLDEYKKPQPAWEMVIDVDELATAEKENWVFEGIVILKPEQDRCLVSLSRGGADATVVREFDLKSKSFVPGGFTLPEAKTEATWKDRDELYISTDFGPGSLTTSGYPRLVKLWKRGTPLEQATTVFEGKVEDVHVTAEVVHDHGHVYELIDRSPTFFTDEMYVHRGDQWVHIDKPPDAVLDTFGPLLLLRLRSDWSSYPSGSLLAADFEAYMSGDRQITKVFTTTERTSLSSIGATKNYLVLNTLDNVRSRPLLLRYTDHAWTSSPLKAPAFGAVEASGVDPDESDDYFLTAEDFLTPPGLYLGTAGTDQRELLKQLPAFFNTDGLEIAQYEAISSDGTKVPYFQISRKGLKLDGANPTLLYGYGGFEISLTPRYSAGLGSAWLERGGVYVLANIRGGGEFGPAWHNAARKEHRQLAYDDFISVAQDLISRKMTSSKHLGIRGGPMADC